MRILFVIPRYWPSVGGAQLHSREWVRRLSCEHQVQVITHQPDGSFIDAMALALPGQFSDSGALIHQIGPNRGWSSLLQPLAQLYPHTRLVHPVTAWVLERALRPSMEAIIRDFQPDVLHAIHIGLVYSSEIALCAARRQGVPFVWTPLPHIAGAGWRGARFRRLYQSADRLIALTASEGRWLVEQGAGAEAVAVIPVGPLLAGRPDPATFRSRYGLADDPVVLFLGQKLPYKGYQQLAVAAPLVWGKHPQARFVFVGPRTPESVAFFAGADDWRLVELPAVDEDEKASALAACDIFCMPSTEESLGGVYLEAWSFGKPVIGATIPTSQEIIRHRRDGLLVEQRAPEIAESILWLLDRPEEQAALGAAGRRKVAEKYDWELLTDHLLSVYHSLAEKAE